MCDLLKKSLVISTNLNKHESASESKPGIGMVDISKKTNERNGIETIVDSNKIMCLNKDNMELRVDHKYLQILTKKYALESKKRKYEIVDESKKTTTLQNKN